MIKPLLCSAILLLSTAASADAPHWTFTYEGFFNAQTNTFDPDSELVGTFTGDDLNRDMRIDRSELTSLTIGTFDYVTCPYSYPIISSCNVSAFLFDLNGNLDFALDGGWSDENGAGGIYHHIMTGDSVTRNVYGRHGRQMESIKYWTPETTLTILAPVPEPAGYAMLGAGLLGLAAFSRRRGSARA